MSYIIGITTFISITIATLVIIPNLLILKEYGVISIDNFKLLYETPSFRSAIFGDYALSLLFAILGTIGIIRSINNQISIGNDKIDINYNPNKIDDEEKNKIKEVFKKYDAFSKEKTISLDTLSSELPNIKLKIYLMQGIIRVKNKEYYYNLKSDKAINNKLRNILLISGFALIILGVILMNIPNNNKKVNYDDRVVIYEVLKNYHEYENDNGGWYYVPNFDISGKSGIIDVSYYDDGISYDDFNTVSENIKKGLEVEDTKVNNYTVYDNSKNNKVIYFSVTFDDYDEYIYYIFKDTKYAIVDAFNYHNKVNDNINKDAKEIANSFDFK